MEVGVNIVAPFIVLIFLTACGPAPAVRGPAPDGAGRAMRMDRFSMRYQTGSLRFIEISGDSAALWGTDRVDMDSVQISLYRDNLRFANVTAPGARVTVGGGDTGIIAITDPAGKIYFGGAFRASKLKVDIDEGTWTGAGPVEFHREPLTLTADAAYGPLTLESVFATRARLETLESTASADRMMFLIDRLLVLLHGHASFVSDTIHLRSDTLTLRLDPTYSHIAPVSY